MTSNEILRADILDILFDNRNKQYGAYVLRKNYNGRLGVALAISLSTFFLAFFLIRMDTGSRPIPKDDGKGEVVIHDVNPPDIKKQQVIPPKPNPLPQVRTEKLTTIAIKQDNLVKNTVADQMSLSMAAISNIKLDGVVPSDIAVVKDPPVVTPVIKAPEDVASSGPESREPEFPGGDDAWLNFLRRNLVPPAELEPGDKKTVSIKFFVGADGSINNFEVLLSAGKAFDNEVIRVLKKMPKWKPAIQNGKAVPKAFTQPVTFVGMEQ